MWYKIVIVYHVCPPLRKIIHSLKLVDYLHVQADNPWYNFYLNPSVYLAGTFLSGTVLSAVGAMNSLVRDYLFVFFSNFFLLYIEWISPNLMPF